MLGQRYMITQAQIMGSRMQPRNYESSRISDQSRFEDEPAPSDDDQIGMYYFLIPCYIIFHLIYSFPLPEASSFLRVQELLRTLGWQLQTLAPWSCWLLPVWDIPRRALRLGDGFQIQPHGVPFVLPIFICLLRQTICKYSLHLSFHSYLFFDWIEKTLKAKECQDDGGGCLLTTFRLRSNQ